MTKLTHFKRFALLLVLAPAVLLTGCPHHHRQDNYPPPPPNHDHDHDRDHGHNPPPPDHYH